jgi:hypothetical protein
MLIGSVTGDWESCRCRAVALLCARRAASWLVVRRRGRAVKVVETRPPCSAVAVRDEVESEEVVWSRAVCCGVVVVEFGWAWGWFDVLRMDRGVSLAPGADPLAVAMGDEAERE